MFVDSSAWYAAYVPSDPQYRIVRKALAAAGRLVTTDYVLDETLTLLKARGHIEAHGSLARESSMVVQRDSSTSRKRMYNKLGLYSLRIATRNGVSPIARVWSS